MRIIRSMKWLKARTFFIGGTLGIPFGILSNVMFDILKGVAINLQDLIINGITFFLLFFLIVLYTNKKSFERDEIT